MEKNKNNSFTSFKQKSIQVKISFQGREELFIHLNLDEKKKITKAHVFGIGNLNFLKLIENWREKLKKSIHYMDIPIPKGNAPEELILREALLKVKGKWEYPYKKERLCFCKKIESHIIDSAIISGAKTTEEVTLLTRASTGCGTCRISVQKILNFRLNL